MEYSGERPTEMSRERLIQELEDTRGELKRQKTLKQMYITRGKETTRELEQLRKYSDDVTLSNAKIAAQVRDETKRKQKKALQKDYEELKVAYLVNEDKYQAAVQEEKDKNKLLQEELDQINVSHSVISLGHEADVTEVRQKVETLQDKFSVELHAEQKKNKLLHDELYMISREFESKVVTARQRAESLQRVLEKELKAHVDTVSKSLQVIASLKVELYDLRHSMVLEMDSLRQNTLEKEKRYERQLEELKARLAVQTSPELKLSTEVSQETHPEKSPTLSGIEETAEVEEERWLQQLQLSRSPSNINTKEISAVDSQ